MKPDRWDDYTGPLCDDPAERAGEDHVREDHRGALWEELAPDERAYLSRTARLTDDPTPPAPLPVDRDGWPAERQP